MSCVYGVFCGKAQCTHDEDLRAVQTKCEELGFDTDPTTVIYYFEKALLQAVSSVLGDHERSQGFFFHLCVEALGESCKTQNWPTSTGKKEEVKTFVGMIDGLAFSPLDRVSDGMDFLRGNTPHPRLMALTSCWITLTEHVCPVMFVEYDIRMTQTPAFDFVAFHPYLGTLFFSFSLSQCRLSASTRVDTPAG